MSWGFLYHIVKNSHQVLWGLFMWPLSGRTLCLCFLFNSDVTTLATENRPLDTSEIQEDVVISSTLWSSQIPAEEAIRTNNPGV